MTNPLLNILHSRKIIQGVVVKIPSRGIFYKNDEIDSEVKNGEITVYPMSTIDEIIMRTTDMLVSGAAIDQVFKKCMPQVRKPKELLSKDVDYLLTQLRKISYGSDVSLTYECPIVEKPKQHNYLISVDYFIQKSKEVNDDMNNYKVKIYDDIIINLRPSKYCEMVDLYQLDAMDKNRTPEDNERFILSTVLALVDNINGISDRDNILEFLKALPVSDLHNIIGRISELNNWGPDFSYVIQCRDCKQEHDITYMINPVDFFILPSRPKTEND